MARAPLLQLTDLSLAFGGAPLLDRVSLTVQPEDRLALVGRNGSGKSTLMKLMAGLVEPDSGTRTLGPGVHAAYLEQTPDFAGAATLGAFAARGLGEGALYRAERAAVGLGFDPDRPVATASGGEKRRAALARVLALEPELLLLDEPTNHLDIAAIEWLEAQLAARRTAFVLISHDRAFLRGLTRGTLWLDRGTLRRQERGFAAFEEWRDATWAEEDLARHKLERKVRAEARWAVEGISARRKRNQGRLRALAALRRDQAAQITRQGTAALELTATPASGRKVIEAEGISKSFGDHVIFRPFSLKVARGDRVGIVGANGAGKTTLLRVLCGELPPDSGTVRLGTGLEIARFDQSRSALDPDATLWENLTSDPRTGLPGRSDQVMVRGAPRHVVGYLKDFLFDEAQARTPVRALSGGEQARLLLARLMAQPANLLVLDEPTNDLDVETLDLLQELLADFDGTALIVSHDRDFLDRIATSTVLLQDGRATVYAGGWTDMQAQRRAAAPESPAPSAARGARRAEPARKAAPATPAGTPPPADAALTFTERHRLERLPDEIARLESEIARLGTLLAEPDLFTRDPDRFAKASAALAQRQEALSRAEDDWLALAERDERAAAGGGPG